MKKLKLFVFKMQGNYFAVPSGRVREILETQQRIKPLLYNRGGALEGLINHDGSIVTILNSAFVLGGQFDKVKKDVLLLLMHKGMEKPVGISVEGVEGLKVIEENKVYPPGENSPKFVGGFLKEEKQGGRERVITVLNLGEFLNLFIEAQAS